jgi:hypothetical protein
MKRLPRRVVELEVKPKLGPDGEKAFEGEVADNPMYGVAMLKIAMELKKSPAAGLDEILKGVLSRMHLDERAFRRFLEQNGGLLRTIAQRKQY